MEPKSTTKTNPPPSSKPPVSPPPSDPITPTDPQPQPSKPKLPLILAGFLFIVLVAVASYFLGRSETVTKLLHQTQPSPSPTTAPSPSPTPTPESTISDWQTYSDDSFKFQYPPDVTLSHQEDSIHLNKWGPTQKPDTELFDGLSLNFTIKQLSGQTLSQYIDAQITQEKDMGFMEVTDDKQPITIGSHSGFTYTITGLGTHQYIFIQKPNSDSFIEIIDSSVDPTNQDFADIIDQILSTFEFSP